MADITPEDAALLQVRLANEHRLTLQQIAQLTIADLTNLFRLLEDESDEIFAKAIRQTVPKIVESYTPNAVVVATGYYQDARALLELSGQLSKKTKNFVPDGTEFFKTNRPEQITEQLIDDSFYHFSEAKKNDNRAQAVTEIKQLSQDAIFETSRQVIEVHSEADSAAENTPRREATSDGCPFCKTMAFHTGIDEGNFHHTDKETKQRVKTFHKGCGCVSAPAFKNATVARPEWADKYEEDYDKARREIMDYNSSLTLKKEFVDGRYVSVYYDADGKQAKQKAINTKNIVNGMRRM